MKGKNFEPWADSVTYERKSLTTEVAIPLFQAILVGLAVVAAVTILGTALTGIAFYGLSAGVVIGALASCVLLAWRFCNEVLREVIWLTEERVGADIDRNGYVGRPVFTDAKLDAIAEKMLRQAYNGFPLSRRYVVNDWRLCSRTEWEAVIKRFRNRGIVIQKAGSPMELVPPSFEAAWSGYVNARPSGYWVNEAGDLVAK